MSVLALPSSSDVKTPFFRPWRELMIISLIAMEMCWIATWFTNLSHTGKPVDFWRAYLVLGAVLAVAHYLGRLMNSIPIRRIARQSVYFLVMLLGLWLGLQILLFWPAFYSPIGTVQQMVASFRELNSISPEFWVTLAMLLVWSRGLGLAHRPLGVEIVIASFQLGVFMFFAYGAVMPLLPLRTVLWAIFAFLVFGLISMSAGRIYQSSRARGARLTKVNRGWLLGIAVTALLVVALGILPAVLLPPGVRDFLGRYLLMGFTILGIFLMLLISPVVIVILMVLPLLQQLWGKISILLPFEAINSILRPLKLPQSVESMVNQVAAAKPLVLWGTLVVVALLILAGVSFRMWIERSGDTEEGESLLNPADLLKHLRKRLRSRFRQAGMNMRGRLNLSPAEQLLAAARVRWIYARMMRVCAALEHPRPPAVTPLEFAPELSDLFGLPDEAEKITQAYVRVRYGEAIETAEELAALNAAWGKIQKRARQQKAEKT